MDAGFGVEVVDYDEVCVVGDDARGWEAFWGVDVFEERVLIDELVVKYELAV